MVWQVSVASRRGKLRCACAHPSQICFAPPIPQSETLRLAQGIGLLAILSRYDCNSIVRRKGKITCKTVGENFRSGMRNLGGSA